jgi:predicted nucleic acid-binding protein
LCVRSATSEVVQTGGSFHFVTEAGKTEVFYSSLVDLELIETGYKIALKERWKKKWKSRRPDGRVRRRAARIAESAAETWSAFAGAINARRINVGDVMGDVPRLMGRYGLGSYDVVHVATALHHEVEPVHARPLHPFAFHSEWRYSGINRSVSPPGWPRPLDRSRKTIRATAR